MFKIDVKTYEKNCIHTITIYKKSITTVLWKKKKHNIQVKLGFKTKLIKQQKYLKVFIILKMAQKNRSKNTKIMEKNL